MPETEPAVKKIWKEYKESNDKSARDKLILHYSPLVKYVAGQVGSRLPQSVDVGDLVSYGMIGLMDAIERFDLSRDIKFETYAMSRIKGAMIDELRTLDWIPRSLRYKAKELEKVYYELENELKRMPEDEEVAKALSISVEELQDTLAELSRSSLMALEDLFTTDVERDNRVNVMDILVDPKAQDPAMVFEQAELKEILADALKKLPEREMIIITLYYYDNLTLKEIGEILDITESRVSQLHTKALLRLKTRLKESQAIGG